MLDPTGRYYNIFMGCIAGGAFGDALGFPVEFMQKSEIASRYGRDGIGTLEMGPNGTAMVSDDTQMTLFTMDGLTSGMKEAESHQTGEPAEICIDRAYLDWYATQRSRLRYSQPFTSIYTDRRLHAQRAPGNTNLSALAQQFLNDGDLQAETDVHARGMIENPINNSRDCGAVARSAPIGLMLNEENYNLQAESVADVAAKAAAVTHGNPMGWLPAAFHAEIISRMTYRRPADPTLERLMANALYQVEQRFPGQTGYADAARSKAAPFQSRSGSPDKALHEFVGLMEKAMRMAADPSLEVEQCLSGLGQGCTGDSVMAMAVFLTLRYQNDFFRAVRTAVNRDGESDSLGAVTGNLMGAWLGYETASEQLNERYGVPYYLETHVEMFDLIRDTVGRAYEIAVLGQ